MKIRKDGRYRLQSNVELFSQWQVVSTKISLLAGIVQNDMECTGENIQEFVEATQKARQLLNEVILETEKHIAANIQEVDSRPKKEKAIISYIDLTSDDDEPIFEKITPEQYEGYLTNDAGGVIRIVKHPKF